MTRRVIFLFALAILLAACTPSFKVQELAKVNELKQPGIVYALPRTVVHIDVEATQTTVRPGPFYLFADKLLGQQNVPVTEIIQWKIKDIHISVSAEPDTAHYFLMTAKPQEALNRINLSPDGILLGINTTQAGEIQLKKTQPAHGPTPSHQLADYASLSPTANLTEKVDTVYVGSGIDTLFLKIPSLRKQVVEKSIGEKAQQAADFIYKLRRERYALLYGDKQVSNGTAMKTMLHKLDELEQQYLSLFVGYTLKETKHFHFEFRPAEGGDIAQELLFRFSETRGVMPASSKIGTPVFIDSRKMGLTSPIPHYKQRLEQFEAEGNGLVVRFPEKALLRVLSNRKEIARQQLPVAQYGELVRMPGALLQSGTSLKLYKNTGALQYARPVN